jgi:hypothetical protein
VYRDAGHILGASIVEMLVEENGSALKARSKSQPRG